jgi:two-component system, OmpR family, phosphate regulon sensor histidine kinase PhoR
MDQSVLKAIKVVNSNAGLPPRAFFNIMLKEVESFMDVPISYFASMENNEKQLIMRGWSRNVMDACATIDKPLVYNIEDTGVWGDCVRERKPVIINDYQNLVKPTKKGYPAGHVKVSRHLNIPVFQGDKIVGVLGVGNKNAPFVNADAEKMTEFMQGVWAVVKTKCV